MARSSTRLAGRLSTQRENALLLGPSGNGTKVTWRKQFGHGVMQQASLDCPQTGVRVVLLLRGGPPFQFQILQ